jgi:DNA-directed RNA polymerase subunit K/omega
MRQKSIEALLEKIGGRFDTVNAVAARAEQLIRGDIPAVETGTRNPVLVAMEELVLDKFHVVPQGPSVNQPILTRPETPSPAGQVVDETRLSTDLVSNLEAMI